MTRPSSAPHPLRVAALRHEHVPDALHLSDQAGWNQTEGDWRRLLDLDPEGALGGWLNQRLVASATYVAYGRAMHWIGMVLVDPAYRGRGYGGAIFGRLLEASLSAGPACVGLDATSYGAGLYRRHGFVPAGPIDRWSGSLRPPTGGHGAPEDAQSLRSEEVPAVAALADGAWDPFAFVDRVERALRSGHSDGIAECVALQQAEWETLFEGCYRQAVME